MKIGVVELDHHRECLNSLCQLLEQGDHAVAVFTTSNIYKELSSFSYVEKFKWYLAEGSKTNFIRKQTDNMNTQDLLVFSTVESEFKTWNAIKLTVKRLIRIHNANTFLARKRSWFAKITPYWLYKDASYFVRKVIAESEVSERERFVAESDHICFTSKEITEHVLNESHAFRHTEKVVEPIPITFNEIEPKTFARAKTFAVIGTIDRKRKDYALLLQVFLEIRQKLEHPIEVLFLGKPKGAFGGQMIKSFETLANENLKIYVWPNGVPQNEFDAEMRLVDIILAPIYNETKYFLNKEVYGFTKISGSINDAIKYARTAVIPEFYPLKNAEELVLRFGTKSQLKQIILDLHSGIEKPKISPENLRRFALKNTAQKINTQFKRLC